MEDKDVKKQELFIKALKNPNKPTQRLLFSEERQSALDEVRSMLPADAATRRRLGFVLKCLRDENYQFGKVRFVFLIGGGLEGV